MTDPISKKGFVLLDTAALVEASWNYKEDHDELQEKLRLNLQRNGIVQNLIVRDVGSGAYEVVNGNHRLRAIIANGIDRVMCYNCGQISDIQAKRIAVETNETRFKSDAERLASVVEAVLNEFDPADFDLTSPITSDMLDGFKKQDEWKAPPPIEDVPFLDLGEDSDPVHPFTCPKCHHKMDVYKTMVKREVVNG